MDYYNHYRKWHDHTDSKYVTYMKRKFSATFASLLPEDKRSRILEIGCANGMAMLTLLDKGYTNLTGVELSPQLAIISQGLGLDVVNSDIFDYFAEDQSKYDFIYMFDVLEHFDETQVENLLRLVFQHLFDNGKLLLVAPNATSPVGTYFRYIDWTHKTSFTPTSMSYVLENAGFKDIYLCEEKHILQPDKDDFDDEDEFLYMQRLSDQSRFYENLARAELVAFFGDDKLSHFTTPNLKVLATKTEQESLSIDVPDTIVDLEAMISNMRNVEDALRHTDSQIFETHKAIGNNYEITQANKQAIAQNAEDIQENKMVMTANTGDILTNRQTITALTENIHKIDHSLEETNRNTGRNHELVERLRQESIESKATILTISDGLEHERIQTNTQIIALFKGICAKRNSNLWSKLAFKLRIFRESRYMIKHQLFDFDYYMRTYTYNRKVSPIVYFLQYGMYEGHNPREDFDVYRYIVDHPELIITGENAVMHHHRASR